MEKAGLAGKWFMYFCDKNIIEHGQVLCKLEEDYYLIRQAYSPERAIYPWTRTHQRIVRLKDMASWYFYNSHNEVSCTIRIFNEVKIGSHKAKDIDAFGRELYKIAEREGAYAERM